MSLNRVEITAEEHGHGTVKIDGIDVSKGVQEMSISLGSRQINRVVITATPGTMAFEGVADVSIVVQGADAMLQLLQHVDPAKLEAKALELLDWGEGNLTEKILEVLKEIIRGTQS